MLPVRTILHPTDFSDYSHHAFRLACLLARDYGARLIVVHVWQPPAVVAGELVPQPIDLSETKQAVQGMLDQMKATVPTVRLERRLEVGDCVTEILRVAAEVHGDLIVMGTHGRTGMSRLLMGSVAEQVLRRAPCPVLTLKSPVVKPEHIKDTHAELSHV